MCLGKNNQIRMQQGKAETFAGTLLSSQSCRSKCMSGQIYSSPVGPSAQCVTRPVYCRMKRVQGGNDRYGAEKQLQWRGCSRGSNVSMSNGGRT